MVQSKEKLHPCWWKQDLIGFLMTSEVEFLECVDKFLSLSSQLILLDCCFSSQYIKVIEYRKSQVFSNLKNLMHLLHYRTVKVASELVSMVKKIDPSLLKIHLHSFPLYVPNLSSS